jgi:hypothetical protein
MEKHVVTPIGNGEYEIRFSAPIKLTAESMVMFGTHNFRLLTDQHRKHVIGVHSRPEVFESWLRTSGVDDTAIEEFRASLQSTSTTDTDGGNPS